MCLTGSLRAGPQESGCGLIEPISQVDLRSYQDSQNSNVISTAFGYDTPLKNMGPFVFQTQWNQALF